jgi:hypothetical protein
MEVFVDKQILELKEWTWWRLNATSIPQSLFIVAL